MKRAWLLLLTTLPLSAQPTINWPAQKTEILDRFRSLVQLDTRAGNETKAVDYLRKILEAEGIPTKTFAKDPARANLVARLKGNGSKRPLLILAHTDVVGVQREKWPVDPFGAVMKDGYIWGRGSVDDKPVLAANLMVFLLLKRNNVPLDRDVIFLAESGEEADLDGVGINYMVENHYAEIDAEFSLTEGGSGSIVNGRVASVSIGAAEKLPARVKLVAGGSSGHGSVPRLDNALMHLGSAVDKIGRWEPPIHFNDVTRTYFEKLAGMSAPEVAARYNGLFNPATVAASRQYLRENDRTSYAMLQTTIVPTMLQAGVGANVIPSQAEATLDIRALPGEDIPAFYKEMANVINDPAVKIEPLPATRPPSPASRLDTEMYRALESAAKAMYPNVVVTPAMSTGASDKAQLRAKGQQSYGIGPSGLAGDRANYGAHSDVERLAESSLYPFVEFVWRAVTEVAATKGK